jgi:hypothetical protein
MFIESAPERDNFDGFFFTKDAIAATNLVPNVKRGIN